MKVLKSLNKVRGLRATVATLGNFDGLHLGHYKIIEKVVARAKTLGLKSVVFTFDPHPQKVISPGTSPRLILRLQDKIKLIESFGADYLVLARFNNIYASKHPREFALDVIKNELRAKEVFVGENYSFGIKKSGTVGLLKKLGQELGFSVKAMGPKKDEGKVVSSSRIRELISSGDVLAASRLLGRFFSITGKVVKGEGRGSVLGYPTVNIREESELVPGRGVYAAIASVGSKAYPAAVNIGSAPTFRRERVVTEAHLIGFKGRAYGKTIRLVFLDKIRGEVRFKGTQELKAAIEKDVRLSVQVVNNVLGGV